MAVFKIDYESDWPGRLVSRFYEQFKSKPNLTALAHDVCGPQFQDLEDAYQSLLMLTSIDDGQGAQLDLLGTVVGQPRLGADDSTYKLYLHARVQANTSNGGPNAIYAVFDALLPNVLVAISPQSPGTMFLVVEGYITNDEALIAASFLADAVIDGVRAYLLWQNQADAQTFTFDGAGEGFDGGAFANVVIGIP